MITLKSRHKSIISIFALMFVSLLGIQHGARALSTNPVMTTISYANVPGSIWVDTQSVQLSTPHGLAYGGVFTFRTMAGTGLWIKNIQRNNSQARFALTFGYYQGTHYIQTIDTIEKVTVKSVVSNGAMEILTLQFSDGWTQQWGQYETR